MYYKSIVKKSGNSLMVPVKSKDGFKVDQEVYVSLGIDKIKITNGADMVAPSTDASINEHHKVLATIVATDGLIISKLDRLIREFESARWVKTRIVPPGSHGLQFHAAASTGLTGAGVIIQHHAPKPDLEAPDEAEEHFLKTYLAAPPTKQPMLYSNACRQFGKDRVDYLLKPFQKALMF